MPPHFCGFLRLLVAASSTALPGSHAEILAQDDRCERSIFDEIAMPKPVWFAHQAIKPTQVKPVDQWRIIVEPFDQMVQITTAGKAATCPARIGEGHQKRFLTGDAHPADYDGRIDIPDSGYRFGQWSIAMENA